MNVRLPKRQTEEAEPEVIKKGKQEVEEVPPEEAKKPEPKKPEAKK